MGKTLNFNLQKPWLYLAPQAGVSESPFRTICKKFGADVVMSEFVSSEAIRRDAKKTRKRLEFSDAERPIGVQIFGIDPDGMAEAAADIEETYRPDFIDINFGCPVKKIVRKNGGAACLKDPELMKRIIRAVDRAVSVPVTVKIRSGYDEPNRDPVTLALHCQDAGVKALTLHARTRSQMYSGKANWDEIANVVDKLEIPVIGNGDVWSGGDAKRMWEQTKCSGIMIARGSHGRPWIFREAKAAVLGKPIPLEPSILERFKVILEHTELTLDFRDNYISAIKHIRKHLGWYTKGLPNGSVMRRQLHLVSSVEEIKEILNSYSENIYAT